MTAVIIAPVSQSELHTAITILPMGEVGELVIGGHQVAEGYLNRPELSMAAFIDDLEFGRLYRTGDKARILPNGTIECLGRIASGQIKLRGQRVELGEIEQIIAKADGCHAVAALIIDDNLVAFCSIGSSDVSKKNIKDLCDRWLPNHMVPADIVSNPWG